MTQAEIKAFETYAQRHTNPGIRYAGTEGRKSYFCGNGFWYDVIEYKNGKITVSLETMSLRKSRLGTYTSITEFID